jgi:hypothetical protein
MKNTYQHPIRNFSILKTVVLFMLMTAFLAGTTSCSRNIGTGCSYWPEAKYKKSSEFSTYRRYN